jgi:hypothetical protein
MGATVMLAHRPTFIGTSWPIGARLVRLSSRIVRMITIAMTAR